MSVKSTFAHTNNNEVPTTKKEHPTNSFCKMSIDKWNIGEDFPAGQETDLRLNLETRTIKDDDFVLGTPDKPRIIWLCKIHNGNEDFQGRVKTATEIRVTEWTRRAGFSVVWILAEPHSQQTVLGADLKPEVVTDPLKKYPAEKRYKMADCHITIRAGMIDHRQDNTVILTSMVSGHLYVLLNSDGVPNIDRPMLETDRKLVELGDYRVDQTWVWVDKETQKRLDKQMKFLLEDGVDREKFARVRLGFKRVHDDDEYSCYGEHHHTEKRFKWEVNGVVVKHTKKPPVRLYADPEGFKSVETPSANCYLPIVLVKKLHEQERQRKRKLRDEERRELVQERRRRQRANREGWRKTQVQRGGR